MLKRKALDQLLDWKTNSTHKALLIDGARQVGKTYLVREFAKTNYEHFVEINLLEVEGAAKAFNAAADSRDLFSRITLYANDSLVPEKTLIFIDEVQAAPDVVTAAKFLIESTGTDYDYVFSGSMLGVELKNIRSWPVGFMRIVDMYPLDFEEFCWANGLTASILTQARDCCAAREPIDTFVHEKLMSLFYYYLAVGGMPEVVAEYVSTRNLQSARSIQNDILELYRRDVTQYCSDDALFVKQIFDLIPSQLNQQNKRFVVNSLGKNARAGRSQNEFLWLVDANVALAVYCVEEPRYPLQLSMKAPFFKLFSSDVGLLACASGMEAVRKIVSRDPVNYGAIYENFVAQELTAHKHRLYYFKNQKMGELDFVLDWPNGRVFPIEVKSGKNYNRHRALDNVLGTENYGIQEGAVLHDDNITVKNKVSYLPIYAVSFL
jgi:predicted AAA+ superfamily ATPase